MTVRHECAKHNIKMEGKDMEHVNMLKYLGLIISNKGN